MRKYAAVVCIMLLAANVVFGKDIFLSLTKNSQDIEKMPTNVTVITQQEIEQKHIENVAELLENQESIVLKNNGSAGTASSIFIRGSSSRETLVLIDGRRINSIGGGSADFANIPVSVIERVEIIRGAGASIYGTSAFGGVINIITKKAQSSSPLIDAGFSFGAFETYNPYLNAAYLSDKFGIFAAGESIESIGTRYPNKNTKYKKNNVFASAQGYLSENSNLSLTGNISDSKLGVPGTWGNPDYETQTPNDEQGDYNKYAKLDFNQIILEDFSLNMSGYMSQDKRDYYQQPDEYEFFGTVYGSKSKDNYISDTMGYEVDIHYKDLFLAGIERWQENYDHKNRTVNYSDGLIDSVKTSSSPHSRINSAVFAQVNLDIWKFRFIPSIRKDSNSVFGDVLTSALTIVFNADEALKFSANAGNVWAAPAFDDLYYDDPYMPGNPDLKPEYGMSYDFGASYTQDKIRLSATVFQIETSKLIAWVPINPDDAYSNWTPRNIDKTKQQGLEIEAGYIMTSWLSHSVTWTKLKAINESDGDFKGNFLLYRPKDFASYTLTIKPIKNLSVSAAALYRSKVFTDEANTKEKELSDITTFNLYANYNINKTVTLWIKGINISNLNYSLTKDYPMPAIALYSAGVSVKLWK